MKNLYSGLWAKQLNDHVIIQKHFGFIEFRSLKQMCYDHK